MKHLTFGEFLQIGRAEWRVQRALLVDHYLHAYRHPFHPARKQWVTRRNLLLRHYARGPLGIPTRIRQTRMINAIRRLKLPSDATILDAGCGHAYACQWLGQHNPQYSLRAMDLDTELMASGRRTAAALGLHNVEFIQADVAGLSDLAEYDLIFSMDLLEHIEDDQGTLLAFRRALRPGGRLLLHLPRRHQEHRRVFAAFRNHTTPEHLRDEYTADEIRDRLEQAGFEIEELGYGFSLWGELAFELNNLFWERETLRVLSALFFHPLCVWLAYMDTRREYPTGNSLLVLAHPARSAP